MASITNIGGDDLITDSRANINDNFANLNADKLETSVLDTDTTLAANSDSKVATQKAVKAYVDAGGNVNATETTKGIVEIATQAEVDAGTGTGSTGATLVVTPSALPRGGIKEMTAGATIAGATTPVPVYQNKTDNEFYACDANDTAAMKYLGFAISDGTDGAALNVQFTGIVSGFTGLSEGEKYYVQDAVGTIGTTIGTYEILVGVAISETEILIQKGARRASGAAATPISASGSEVITTGFRPSSIRLTATCANEFYISTLNVSYRNGVLSGATTVYNEASVDSGVQESARLYDTSIASGNYLTFSFSSISDTAFTITYTETGTFSEDVSYIWEAEGEL